MSEGSPGGASSSLRRLLSVAAALLLVAGCGGAGRGRPGPRAPDHLTVIAQGGGLDRFRIELDCAVADHEACSALIRAIVGGEAPAACAPVRGGDRLLRIDGSVGGAQVGAVLRRRTDCEIAAYDAAARAVGL